ncbi:sugar-binding transcriptional regulator [Neobacillus mesonae]|uniref:sugar-binding transcriptional regulator n=1 Tax=Neobacillus mesonae TaxID=1193713 RepID=UPI00203A54B3|nr:sugar-binding transcriptional regulator [Neobacillus mesonae]MCM3570446.1 sugar-binding transcriptional regulator [Neobacillus mesonae]
MTYENSLIINIAWKYYNEGMTQNEIAESLNLSRMKVIKYLEIAKASNIIQFKINLDQFADMDLQTKIKQQYHLEDLYIVPSSSKNLLDSLSKAAAQYIEDRITSDTMINVGYGQAVSRTLGHLNISTKYKVTFVSLSGGVRFYIPTAIDSSSDYYSNPNYSHYIMPAPLVVSTESLAKQLINEKPIKKIMEMIPYSTITIVGIGAVNERATIVKEEYLSTSDMEIIKSMGAAGDILSQFYDINGQIIDYQLHKQLVSTDIHLLKSLNHVVAVAGGLEKKEAIIGALRGGYIDVLITDEAVARSLIE